MRGVPSQELPVLLAPAPVRCLASEGGSFAKLQHEAAWSLTYRFVLAVLFSDLLPGSEHFCCRAVRSQAGVVLAPALPLPSAQLSLHNRYIEIHLFFFLFEFSQLLFHKSMLGAWAKTVYINREKAQGGWWRLQQEEMDRWPEVVSLAADLHSAISFFGQLLKGLALKHLHCVSTWQIQKSSIICTLSLTLLEIVSYYSPGEKMQFWRAEAPSHKAQVQEGLTFWPQRCKLVLLYLSGWAALPEDPMCMSPKGPSSSAWPAASTQMS